MYIGLLLEVNTVCQKQAKIHFADTPLHEMPLSRYVVIKIVFLETKSPFHTASLVPISETFRTPMPCVAEIGNVTYVFVLPLEFTILPHCLFITNSNPVCPNIISIHIIPSPI